MTLSPTALAARLTPAVLPAGVLGAAAVLGAGLVVAGTRVGTVLGLVLVVAVASAARDLGVRCALLLIPVVALIRRLTGGPNAYVENDPLVLLIPLLLAPALLGLVGVRLDPRLRGARPLWLGFILWSAAVTLLVPGSGLTVRLYGVLTTLLPAVVGYAVYEGLHPRLPRLSLLSVAVLAPLAAGYGIVQYLVDPPWDLAWLADRQDDLISVGLPEHGGYRIFGSMEAPGPYALYLGMGILALGAYVLWSRSSRLTLVLGALGAAAIVTALVLAATRSVLFGLPLVALLAVVLLPGRRRGVAVVVAVAVAAATLLVPALVADNLYDNQREADRLRVGQVSDDNSLAARIDLLDQFNDVAQAPWGTGLGSSGQATRLETGESNANLDNGYLALAAETGVVGFVLLLLLLRAAIRQGRRMLPSVSGAEQLVLGWCLLVVLYFAVELLTGSVLAGSSALVFWIALGLLTRQAVRGSGEERVDARGQERIAQPVA